MQGILISIGVFIAIVIAYLHYIKQSKPVLETPPQTGVYVKDVVVPSVTTTKTVNNEPIVVPVAPVQKPVDSLISIDGAIVSGTDIKFLSNTREKCFEECLADDKCVGMTLYTHPGAPGCGLISDINNISNLTSKVAFREAALRKSYLDNSKYIKMQNVGYSSNDATWLSDMDHSQCESACSNNENCQAYMYDTTGGNTKGCSLKHNFDLWGDMTVVGGGRTTKVGVKTGVLRSILSL